MPNAVYYEVTADPTWNRNVAMLSQARILCATILAAAFATRAATLKGVVLLDELGGQPLPNVEITTAVGSNPAIAKSNGAFSLDFRTKSPGDTVQLIIQKPGYSVVNKVQLVVTLSNNPDDHVLTLLLCRTPDLEEMARRFYGLKSREAIERGYAERIRNATAVEIVKLTTERDQALQLAASLAANFAHKDAASEPVPKLYEDAMRTFLGGDIPGAIAILQNDKLAAEVSQSKREKDEAQNDLESAIQSYLLKGQLLATQFNFTAAAAAYQKARAADPDSFAANFLSGSFSQTMNRLQQAEKDYNRCLQLPLRPWERALTLNSLGILHGAENRTAEARQDYAEALKIFRVLAKSDSPRYLPHLAMVANNVGNLESVQNHFTAAEAALEEALGLYRDLANESRAIYLPDVARTLTNLGANAREENRLDEARKDYNAAVTIYEELDGKTPDRFLPAIAGALINLANLNAQQNRTEDAQENYQKALNINRELATRSPNTYLPAIALILTNQGNLYRSQNQLDKAQGTLAEALTIRRRLVEENRDAYSADLAATLTNLGIVESLDNQLPQAHSAFQEALGIVRQLVSTDTDTFSPTLGMILGDIGLLYRQERQLNEARQALDEALEIYRRLAENSQNTYLPFVAGILTNIGLVSEDESKIEEAHTAYSVALKIYRQFAATDPAQYNPDVERTTALIARLPEK